MISFVVDKDLGFVLQPPEGPTVNHPVAIALKGCPVRVLCFDDKPTQGLSALGRVRGQALRLLQLVLGATARSGHRQLPFSLSAARKISRS